MTATRRVLIYNPNSGLFVDRLDAGLSIASYLSQALENAGLSNIELVEFQPQLLKRWKSEWQRLAPEQRPKQIWALGGDGTVKALADIAQDLNIPLGVLPGGTMNLMARDLGMSLDLDEALKQLDSGDVKALDVASVNGDRFLCISNLGLATGMTRKREQLRKAHPWIRWPLLGWYLLRYLWGYPALTIELKVQGQQRRIRSRAAFISNNILSDDSWLIPTRTCLDCGQLGIYVVRGDSFWTLPKLALEALIGNWKADKDLDVLQAQEVQISVKGRRSVRLMSDGELARVKLPLHYRVEPGALRVICPGDKPTQSSNTDTEVKAGRALA